jgi:hypothetical protein
MKTKKNIFVILLSPNASKNDRSWIDHYEDIFNQLIHSDMCVFAIEYIRLQGDYDPDYYAWNIVGEMDDFFHNPYYLDELETDSDDDDRDPFQEIIQESKRLNGGTPDTSDASPHEEPCPDGNFIYVQVVSDKEQYDLILQMLGECELEEESVKVFPFVSSYSAFFMFQQRLMMSLIKKAPKDKKVPPGLLDNFGSN